MERNEVMGIKEDMAEIKETVKNIEAALIDLRVLVAGEYLRKQEFEDYKKEHTGTYNSLLGWLIGAYALIVTGLGILLSAYK